MLSNQTTESDKHTAATETPPVAAPAISLPKGGGAIRGIGEKFAANPVTGTGSLTVPIFTSPGRAGFGPQLALSYDSGAGNGPFGFGWSLGLPSVMRKTDKGLPQYVDAAESDVFILSGAEDLVPLLVEDPNTGTWAREDPPLRTVYHQRYRLHRYRPRVEGLFARIERWVNVADPHDTCWRSISKDNVTTWYGRTAESRIFDPADPTRIFSWLICESSDDKGNAVAYQYKRENADGVDLVQAHERNRTDITRSANRYLKHVFYGNRTPYFPDLTLEDPVPLPTDWCFEVVFDYGEHGEQLPLPQETDTPWACRLDAFSSYRATFEVRTYRLCRRALMFHHFPGEPGVGQNCLVRSTDFTHAQPGPPPQTSAIPPDPTKPYYAFLLAVTQTGYQRSADGSYRTRELPPLEFGYTDAAIDETVRDVDPESLENLPFGLDGRQFQWVDLDGEGLSGILTEQAGSWFYKPNLSPAPAQNPVPADGGGQTTGVRFGAVQLVARKPSLAALSGGRQQLLDLAGDGQLDLVEFAGPTPGFFERTEEEDGGGDWERFTPFTALPVLDWADPNLKFVDLTGDGHADLLISEDDAFRWYPSLAEAGFGPAQRLPQARDEERGPRLLFADGTQSIFLADVSGDGLADLVRVRNGEVCYWPNLGYGRFGAKVTMDGAPWFEAPDLFDGRRLRLADLDGSGTTDLIYFASGGVQLYFNQSGNAWGARRVLDQFPPVESVSSATALDLLGNGTACLVWSSSLPAHARRPMRYLDLMGGQKPHLLVRVTNNLGAETHVRYAPSTRFYVADKLAGTPWVTRIPFPVHVVERVETYDWVSHNRFVTRYAYHHGFYDGVEREFHGFGLVEQWDTEELGVLQADPSAFPSAANNPTNIEAASYVPPVLTRTWFHTGAYLDGTRISQQFAHEYYRPPGLTDQQFQATLLPDTILPPDLGAQEEREACRALKGSLLRQEIYAVDGSATSQHPYTVSERDYTIEPLQPLLFDRRHAVFFTHPRETVDSHVERNPADPRVTHQVVLEVDPFGNVLQSAAIGYGRLQPDPTLAAQDQAKQTQTLITCTKNTVTKAIDGDDAYRTPLPSEGRTYELTGLPPVPTAAGRYAWATLLDAVGAAAVIAYEATPSSSPAGDLQKRLLGHVRTRYRADDLSGPLPLGHLESLALPYASYTLALTPGLVAEIYGGRVTEAMLLDDGKYVHSEGDANWWIPSGLTFYAPDAGVTPGQELALARQHFFLPRRFQDPFGHSTAVTYDANDLLLEEVRDSLGNVITVVTEDEQGNSLVALDYRVLQPWLVVDPNGNRAAVRFDELGLVVATAVMGKVGEPDPARRGDTLDDPTTRLEYRLFEWVNNGRPTFVHTFAREQHGPANPRWQEAYSYSDGFGREIQKKIQAEPGPVDGTPADPRWVGSGWTIYNNKGKPVRQYEQFFSATQLFQRNAAGVSSTLFYDPLQRVEATLHPDHSYAKVVFDPWRQETWDANDTVLAADPRDDPHVGDYFRRLEAAAYLPTWHEARASGQLGAAEQAAATQTEAHAQTPTVAYFDTLGRPFLTLADNRPAGIYATRAELDIGGRQLAVSDALGRTVMRYDYDLPGHRLRQVSVDAGTRWTLIDVSGQPIYGWDSRDHRVRHVYDALRRPTHLYARQGLSAEQLVERTLYGEVCPGAAALNLRGKAFQRLDGAGVAVNEAYDFKGNLLRATCQLARQYTQQIDWTAAETALTAAPPDVLDLAAVTAALAPLLEAETFTSSRTYDALNRPVTLTSPDASVIHPIYNEANLLERLEVNLRGAAFATPFVSDIDYNARGQRELIAYVNGAKTLYAHDPLTFRLTRLQTLRGAEPLQNLSYTYDPAGNITAIRDDAQQTRYFDNQVVDASSQYVYDALYRLVTADGREHIGQLTQPQVTWDDGPRMHQPQPTDGQAMRRYSEAYTYDEVGNLLALAHSANGGNWSRTYAYDEPNPTPTTNRLTSTTVTGLTETYAYDAHGNMIGMPHLAQLDWDIKDQLQRVGLGGGGTAYYVYDAGRQRVRKVIARQNGTRQQERLYLGGFEIYREYNGDGTSVTLERETLHILDGTRRIALVETKTLDMTAAPSTLTGTLTRYQVGNHLGSAVLELGELGEIISYEEYYPYGSTSYQATRSGVEVSLKRYRYSGKERDEETGLYEHKLRYYACWLGRWLNPDPAGMVDGTNLYEYVRGGPIRRTDAEGAQSKSESDKESAFIILVPWAARSGAGAATTIGGEAGAAATIGGEAGAAATFGGAVGTGASMLGGLGLAMEIDLPGKIQRVTESFNKPPIAKKLPIPTPILVPAPAPMPEPSPDPEIKPEDPPKNKREEKCAAYGGATTAEQCLRNYADITNKHLKEEGLSKVTRLKQLDAQRLIGYVYKEFAGSKGARNVEEVRQLGASVFRKQEVIASYDFLKSFATKGKYAAHHIIPQKFLKATNMPTESGPSILLTVNEHKSFHKVFERVVEESSRDLIGYNRSELYELLLEGYQSKGLSQYEDWMQRVERGARVDASRGLH